MVDTLTYSISGRKDHTKVDEVYTWTNTCGVTQGTGLKLAITPKGARNIKNVTIYKLVDGEKQELASTLISGTGFPGSGISPLAGCGCFYCKGNFGFREDSGISPLAGCGLFLAQCRTLPLL